MEVDEEIEPTTMQDVETEVNFPFDDEADGGTMEQQQEQPQQITATTFSIPDEKVVKPPKPEPPVRSDLKVVDEPIMQEQAMLKDKPYYFHPIETDIDDVDDYDLQLPTDHKVRAHFIVS